MERQSQKGVAEGLAQCGPYVAFLLADCQTKVEPAITKGINVQKNTKNKLAT